MCHAADGDVLTVVLCARIAAVIVVYGYSKVSPYGAEQALKGESVSEMFIMLAT